MGDAAVLNALALAALGVVFAALLAAIFSKALR
jgi:hypothetical protein